MWKFNTPVDDLIESIRTNLFDFATMGAGANEFDAFHEAYQSLYPAMHPGYRVFVRAAQNRFRQLHEIPNDHKGLNNLEAQELLFFGWWLHEQVANGNVLIRTDD